MCVVNKVHAILSKGRVLMKSVLLHCAMGKEAKQIADKLGLKQVDRNIYSLDNVTLLISGIGKQKTAIELVKYLENNTKPDLIINIGYAGSVNEKVGTWVSIKKSYNLEWEIPGEEKYSMDVGNQDLITIDSIKNLPCYSAEGFVTKSDIKENVIFDMELHSLAIICDMYNIKLASLKKVSDNLSMKDYYKNIDMKDVMELESCTDFLAELESKV